VGIAVLAFVVMEPLTAAVHRLVMHGVGWTLHRSHHRRVTSRLEANDAYPLVFAGLTMSVMALGFHAGGRNALVPATVGMTAYGACYGFVHEVYIHQRVRFPWRVGVLQRLKEAHDVHHRWTGGPYGMLAPRRPGWARPEGSVRGRASRAATASFRHVGTRTRVDHTS